VRKRVPRGSAVEEFAPDELRLIDMLFLSLLLHVIREEEDSQDGEHDEELECDDEPELLTRRCEATEAISVEAIGTHERIWSRCLSRHEVDEVM